MICMFRVIYDLYVQSYIMICMLVADIFENFRNMCMKVYGARSCSFFISPRISMASMFKQSRCKMRITNRP